MKRIVFVSNNIPLPDERNGNTVTIINVIRCLKKRGYIIDFYLFSDNWDRDLEYIDDFKSEVDFLICKHHISKYIFFLNYFRENILSDTPVYFCNFNSGFYYPIFRSSKKILFAADSVAFLYYKERGFEAKVRYYKLLFEERFLYRKFHKIVFVSPLDLQFSKLSDSVGLFIPIGYPQNFDADIVNRQYEYDLCFSGNYEYYPNTDAFRFFVNNIFPILLKEKSNVKICFLGRNPTSEMVEFSQLNPANIIVTGEVGSIESYLHKSRIYISPLRKGSGMKNKILQAMICKLPIVCTSESIAGITTFNSSSLFIEDNAQSFANAIIKLLHFNEVELQRLGNLNYDTYKDNYTWDSIISKYYEPLFSE